MGIIYGVANKVVLDYLSGSSTDRLIGQLSSEISTPSSGILLGRILWLAEGGWVGHWWGGE
jgi:hypothetical protein